MLKIHYNDYFTCGNLVYDNGVLKIGEDIKTDIFNVVIDKLLFYHNDKLYEYMNDSWKLSDKEYTIVGKLIYVSAHTPHNYSCRSIYMFCYPRKFISARANGIAVRVKPKITWNKKTKIGPHKYEGDAIGSYWKVFNHYYEVISGKIYELHEDHAQFVMDSTAGINAVVSTFL